MEYEALNTIGIPNPLLGFSDTLKTFWTTKRLKKKIRKGIIKDFYFFSSIMYSRADINIIWFIFETRDIILKYNGMDKDISLWNDGCRHNHSNMIVY